MCRKKSDYAKWKKKKEKEEELKRFQCQKH